MSACELRLGRYQEALADVHEVDLLCCDPPYSERTHSGHDRGTHAANEVIKHAQQRKLLEKARAAGRGTGKLRGGQSERVRRAITYPPWTAADVEAFVTTWSPRVRGWFVAMTDHDLAPVYERILAACGRYTFAPLQFMHPGSRVRMAGDGPALWSTTIVVARPRTREFLKWGALPGGYVLPSGTNGERVITGGKPLWLMRALVRDYSRPGDLVCDPCAGGGTTLLAARQEGRRAIGAECDPGTYELARARLERPYTPDMFARLALATSSEPSNDNATQGALFDAEND